MVNRGLRHGNSGQNISWADKYLPLSGGKAPGFSRREYVNAILALMQILNVIFSLRNISP